MDEFGIRFRAVARHFFFVALLSLLSPLAWASDAGSDCVANFVHDPYSPTAGTRFGTVVNVPNMSAESTLQALRGFAEHDGFLIDTLDLQKNSLTFWQGEKYGSKSMLVIAGVDPQSHAVALSAMTPPGMQVNRPEQIRDGMCSMLARLSAAAPIFPQASSTERAPPPDTDARTAPPSTAKQLNVLKPTAAFDAATAKAALEEGNSVITGTACAIHSNAVNLARNQKIFLFPATSYTDEVFNLMHKAKPGRDTVEWSQEAQAVRLEGMSNANGQFRFAKMKPGKYYLMTTLSTSIVEARDVNVGTGVSGNVSVDIYEKQNFQSNFADMLEALVNISKDGETKDITLSPRRTFSLFKESGAAGIFGCHSTP